MPRQLEPDELLAALQAEPQSEEHWTALYGLLAPYLLAVAFRALGIDHGASAHDILQETFAQLARAPVFSRFEDFARLRAYLSTVAVSRAYDLLRREGRTRTNVRIEAAIHEDIRQSAEDIYAASELLGRIHSRLSTSDRELLDQVLWGNGAPEIAERFGITPVTARVRLHRLRNRIGAIINALQEGESAESPER